MPLPSKPNGAELAAPLLPLPLLKPDRFGLAAPPLPLPLLKPDRFGLAAPPPKPIVSFSSSLLFCSSSSSDSCGSASGNVTQIDPVESIEKTLAGNIIPNGQIIGFEHGTSSGSLESV